MDYSWEADEAASLAGLQACRYGRALLLSAVRRDKFKLAIGRV
jgi:hypothetical protein